MQEMGSPVLLHFKPSIPVHLFVPVTVLEQLTAYLVPVALAIGDIH